MLGWHAGGEESTPWDAGVRVSSPCGATSLAASGRCSESVWRGRRYGDVMWHGDRTQHSAACPGAHGGERPAGGTHVPAGGRDPLGAAVFYCHGGFRGREGAAAAPIGHFPAPGPPGHVASRRASPIPTLVHHVGKMFLLPTAREGVPAPKGAQALWAGVSPGDGFPPRSVLPEGVSSCLSHRDLGFGPIVQPGLLWPRSGSVQPGGEEGRRLCQPAAPLRCHPPSPGSRSPCGRRSCAIPDPRHRARVSGRPSAARPPSRRQPKSWEGRGRRCGEVGGF